MPTLTEEEVRALIAQGRASREAARDQRNVANGLLSAWQVRDIRERLRLTQREMADELGVSERTYQRWEQGFITKSGSRMMKMIREDRL